MSAARTLVTSWTRTLPSAASTTAVSGFRMHGAVASTHAAASSEVCGWSKPLPPVSQKPGACSPWCSHGAACTHHGAHVMKSAVREAPASFRGIAW